MKNFIKRIFVGVSIALIIGFVRSCNVKAAIINNGGMTSGTVLVTLNQNPPTSTYLVNNGSNQVLSTVMSVGNYPYIILDTCTNGTPSATKITGTSCNTSCFVNGELTYFDNGSCTINGSTGRNILYQVQVNKFQVNGSQYKVDDYINFGGTGKTYINSYWASDNDMLSIVATNQQSANDIISNQNTNHGLLIGSLYNYFNQIHNNQYSNTQDIINNQNNNNQQIIDSSKICTIYDKSNIKTDNSYLSSNGSISNSNNWGITDYLEIRNADIETMLVNDNTGAYFCYYDFSKTLLGCYSINLLGSVTPPSNNYYIRVSIAKTSNKPVFKICKNGNQALSEQQQETNKQLQDLNNNLTDETGPNLNGMQNSAGWLPPGPVDSILNLPLSLLNNLTVALEESCTPAVLDVPYVNSQIILPCMTDVYEEIGITSWVNVIGGIASAFMLFAYFCKLYKWVDDTLTFRENNYIDNWGGV